MKPFREFEGKNVGKAVDNACRELGVNKNDLEYDVLSSGSSGIFGILGVKNAKIRVKIAEGKKAKDDFSSEGVSSLVDEAFGNNDPEEKKVEKKSEKKPEKKIDKRSFSKKTDIVEPIVKKTSKDSVKPAVKKTLTEKVQPSDLPVKDENSDTPSASSDKEKTGKPVFSRPMFSKDPVPEEIETLGTEVLQKMADLITEDAVIKVKNDAGKLFFNIEGGKSAMLIGRRGQTLEALQYLVDKIVNKKSEYRIRVQIDVEGYLDTRKENLKNLARKLAEKAKKTGKSTTIGQMNAHDRRIVHLTLKDDKGVRTQSMGDGYYRRLVIFPRKNQFRKKRQSFRPESKRPDNAASAPINQEKSAEE